MTEANKIQSSGIVATILLAIIAVLSALISTIHVTMPVDLAPNFMAIDTQFQQVQVQLSDIDQRLASLDIKIDQRLNSHGRELPNGNS